MEGISERRVARDLANSILKNRISEFEKLDVEFLTKKYNLVFNEELRLYFIPDAPRGRPGLTLPTLPSDIRNALIEKAKADENTVHLPCWVSDRYIVTKDRKHFIVFTIHGTDITAMKLEVTVTNKDKLEKRLGRKLSGVTKYVMPRRTVSALYEKYSKETTE